VWQHCLFGRLAGKITMSWCLTTLSQLDWLPTPISLGKCVCVCVSRSLSLSLIQMSPLPWQKKILGVCCTAVVARLAMKICT
jgi:hypothetical protein